MGTTSSILRRIGSTLAMALLLFPLSLRAQVARDKAIRAVLLFHIAQLTEWPTNAFTSDQEPFVLGVVGEDPFGEILEGTVDKETVRGRRIVIERYRTAADIQNPHLLFISSSESRSLGTILRRIDEKPILTVADVERAEQRGVMVHLYWEDNRAKMIINQAAVASKKFVMSPRLMAVAQKYP
jgi:hypothetical protein